MLKCPSESMRLRMRDTCTREIALNQVSRGQKCATQIGRQERARNLYKQRLIVAAGPNVFHMLVEIIDLHEDLELVRNFAG